MKKRSLFVLLAVVGLMVSCGGTSSEEPSSSENTSSEIPSSSEAVADTLYFGLGNKAAYAVKSSGAYIQVDVTMGGFLFDKDGKVLKSYIDVMQVKIAPVDATSAGVRSGAAVNSGSDFKSKRELGDAYNMASAATKGEWYVQANAWQTFAAGKTAAQVAAANGTEALTATVTITTDDFEACLNEAWTNRVEFASFETAELKLGIGMTSSHSGLKTTINTLASLFDADGKVVLAAIDVFQPAYAVTEVTPATTPATYTIGIKATDKTTDSVNSVVKSKRDLGDLYGMGTTATKGEWYVQANAWQTFVVGKTAAEAVAANGTEALTATVTITTTDFENCLTEAFGVII